MFISASDSYLYLYIKNLKTIFFTPNNLLNMKIFPFKCNKDVLKRLYWNVDFTIEKELPC